MNSSKKTSFLLMALTVLLLASFGVIASLLHRQNAPESLLALAKERAEYKLEFSDDPQDPSVFKKIQEKIQKIDATHLIRKYHQHLALFDVQRLLKSHVVVDMEAPETGGKLITPHPFHFDASNLTWKRTDNATPLDVMRLTFRGNGVPEDAEKLAESNLLEPKLQAFYEELTQPNTTLWKSPKSIRFQVNTHDDRSYIASSTPFISMQPISKTKYAKMKAAALPFLWNAYSQKDTEATEGDSTKPIKRDKAISGDTLDSDTIQSLYFKQILEDTPDPEQARALKTAIVGNSRPLQDHFDPQNAQGYLKRLAQHDPEFSSLFLINNLFEQYNLFSVFKEGVTLKINAIDTKLNITYISYNINFDVLDDLFNTHIRDTNSLSEAGCNGKPIDISDEFFLIISDSQAYLMRVYLPSCHLTQEDYDQVDTFINSIRILNDSNLSAWGTSAQYQDD
ncbi:MAG: hypothetical protein P8P30_05175 [Rickettsiales bacterium]|nr:hypothetical protein [Rickettsiales bacterium]